MLFNHITFIGIDPTAGQRPFTYTALDSDLRLLALGQGNMEDVLAFVGGQRQACVGVCAPSGPAQGLLERPEVRQTLTPPPKAGRWAGYRLAEYQLRHHNIHCTPTGSDESSSPGWMRSGFTLHRRIAALGYRAFPEPGELRWLETYPHAVFCALLGMIPFQKDSFEGRIQRQLILYEKKLRLPDPMDVFEEVTRHRLLQGIWPLKNLHTPSELDALAAAYTAWFATVHADEITLLGHAEEGQIVLPVANLKTRYGHPAEV